MNKEIISTKQGYYIIIIYTIGATLILTRGDIAKQDTWISILIAMFMAIPMVLIYGKIVNMYPGNNLYKILEMVFGKVLGKIISISYIWYFFHLGSIVIRYNTEFIQTISLEQTPQYFPALFFGVLAIYMIKSGVEGLGRWTNTVFLFVLILLFVINGLAISDFKYENIKPILYNGWTPVLKSSYSFFSFPFADTIVLLTLFNLLEDNKKVYKVYIVGILVAGTIILITFIKNTLILGFPLLTNIHFPTHFSNMVVSLGFIQRIEIITSMILMFTSLTKICVCLFASCIGISQVFSFSEYKDIAVPMGLMMVSLSLILYSNTNEMIEFVDVYIYYTIPFQIILPILILILGIIRKKKTVNGE